MQTFFQKAYERLNWAYLLGIYRRWVLAIDGSDTASVQLSSQFRLTVHRQVSSPLKGGFEKGGSPVTFLVHISNGGDE